MALYRVCWRIDIDADSPIEAALLARVMQTAPDTLATVFEVVEHGSEDFHSIDLSAQGDNRVH